MMCHNFASLQINNNGVITMLVVKSGCCWHSNNIMIKSYFRFWVEVRVRFQHFISLIAIDRAKIKIMGRRAQSQGSENDLWSQMWGKFKFEMWNHIERKDHDDDIATLTAAAWSNEFFFALTLFRFRGIYCFQRGECRSLIYTLPTCLRTIK